MISIFFFLNNCLFFCFVFLVYAFLKLLLYLQKKKTRICSQALLGLLFSLMVSLMHSKENPRREYAFLKKQTKKCIIAARQCLEFKLLVFILNSCCVFVGFLLAAFAVWTTFGSKPPLNCTLAVLNTILMGPFELGDFW